MLVLFCSVFVSSLNMASSRAELILKLSASKTSKTETKKKDKTCLQFQDFLSIRESKKMKVDNVT